MCVELSVQQSQVSYHKKGVDNGVNPENSNTCSQCLGGMSLCSGKHWEDKILIYHSARQRRRSGRAACPRIKGQEC